MSLGKYQAKRQFDQTPEPAGATGRAAGPLRFVIQKHLARRLHYDFRLEAGGVLISWAVPKRPSLDPDQRRLAIHVEDHPLEYISFQGAIPQGNYGAGTVAIWDTGPYLLPRIDNRQEIEQAVESALKSGKLHVLLHGTKLQGEFILTKLKSGKENEWLFFKKRDAFASDRPVPDDPLPAGGDRVAKAMPSKVKPMLATAVTKPFDHPDWLFELKWDGYRAIAEVTKNKVQLYSRRGLSFEQRYPPIVESLARLGHEAVLDGEIVVIDDAGKPQFQLLQGYAKSRKGRLVYQVFDLLYLDGYDLRNQPLLRRKEILSHILGRLPNIELSEHIREHGIAFFNAVAGKGLEGAMAKDVRSGYQQGIRSRSWLKIKTHLRQEAVIGGYTEPRGSREEFGSLVLGVYSGSDLVYIGHAGSGFTADSLAGLRTRLAPLSRTTCPFKKKPKSSTPAHWVEPRCVCEVSFAGWTDDGHMRFPVFMGLREDKTAADVHREDPEPAAEIVPAPTTKPKKVATVPTEWKRQPNQQLSIGGREVRVTNLPKLYWPDDGFAKGDLIEYYRQTAEVILPYLHDRPLSLHRHPNGIDGKSFFQKDVTRQPPPEWVSTVDLPVDSGERTANRTVLCQDAATLVYLANLGCIEMNPWNSRVSNLDRPDYSLIDLDPEDVPFEQVVEVAQMVRMTLDKCGAVGFCKTSGKRGLHIYVPFGARYQHEQARQFAELIARIVNLRLPHITSLARHPAERQKRVYLDCLQNGHGKTLAAPYSVRPNPGATVSTPLGWAEVKPGLDPSDFNIRTLAGRLDRVGDLWAPVLEKGIDLPQCVERLAAFMAKELRKAQTEL